MVCKLSTVPDEASLALEEPVRLEEIYHAIKCLEFLKKTWETTKEDLLQIVN